MKYYKAENSGMHLQYSYFWGEFQNSAGWFDASWRKQTLSRWMDCVTTCNSAQREVPDQILGFNCETVNHEIPRRTKIATLE